MNDIFFSIITPIYNQEVRVKKCIESVLSQTYKNFEFILIDDGSKDNSYAVAKTYADKNKRIQLYHQENKGSSTAYNVGLEKAKGDYFIILDNDDWLDANTLETLNDYINKYNQPDVIQMGVYIHHEDSNDAKKEWHFSSEPIFANDGERNRYYYLHKEKLINTNTRKTIKAIYKTINYEGIGPYADEVVMGKIFEISHSLLLIPDLLFHVNKLNTSDGSQHLSHDQLVEITLREIKMIDWLKANSLNKPPYIATFNSFEFFRASIIDKNTNKQYRKKCARFFLKNKKYLMSFEKSFKRSSLFYYLVCLFPSLYALMMRKRRGNN